MTTSILDDNFDANAIPTWERDYANYCDARTVVIGLALDHADADRGWLGRIDFYLYEQQMAQRPWGDVWGESGREMPLGRGRGANADTVSRF